MPFHNEGGLIKILIGLHVLDCQCEAPNHYIVLYVGVQMFSTEYIENHSACPSGEFIGLGVVKTQELYPLVLWMQQFDDF